METKNPGALSPHVVLIMMNASFLFVTCGVREGVWGGGTFSTTWELWWYSCYHDVAMPVLNETWEGALGIVILEETQTGRRSGSRGIASD